MEQAGRESIKVAARKRPGAGRPAASEVAGRVEHLLDTATEVFLEHGYGNTNIAEIARRAGASKRTIYARYPTKAALFGAIVTRKTGKLQESYGEVLLPGKPLGEVLEGFGMQLLRAMSQEELRALQKVSAAESQKFPKLASKFWEVGPKRSMLMLRDYLAAHPEFNGGQPEHAAEMFLSLCCGLTVVRAQLQKSRRMPEETIRFYVSEAVRIFLSAYSRSAPARPSRTARPGQAAPPNRPSRGDNGSHPAPRRVRS
jgi:AcrR family transcriptional regulator